jgi:hypothetical protein
VILLHYAADNTFLAQSLLTLSRGAVGNLCSNTMCQSSQSHLVIGQQSLTLGFDNSIVNVVIIVIANTLNGTIKIARSISAPQQHQQNMVHELRHCKQSPGQKAKAQQDSFSLLAIVATADRVVSIKIMTEMSKI